MRVFPAVLPSEGRAQTSERCSPRKSVTAGQPPMHATHQTHQAQAYSTLLTCHELRCSERAFWCPLSLGKA